MEPVQKLFPFPMESKAKPSATGRSSAPKVCLRKSNAYGWSHKGWLEQAKNVAAWCNCSDCHEFIGGRKSQRKDNVNG